MSEDKGLFKPIFITVSSTVLTAVILYYLGIDKPKPDDSNNPPKPPQSEQTRDTRSLQTTIMKTDGPADGPADESRADAGFELRKQATLRVWNRMQEIDAQSDWSSLSAADFQQIAYAYSQIDLSNADPVLITHISESISTYNEGGNVYASYEAEVAQVQQAYMYDHERTQAYQWVMGKYQQSFANVTQKCTNINDRDKTLARMFTERYDVVFVD